MNPKRLILAIMTAFAGGWATNFPIHGGSSKRICAQTMSFWREAVDAVKRARFFGVFAAISLTTCSTMALGANTNQVPGLDGTWICLSATIDGKPLPDETVRLLRLTLTRIRYKTQKGSEILFNSTYTVDPKKSPKQINMMGTEGALKGKEALGIYLADGDTFQICYTMPGKERPDSFESAPGSGAYLIVWQRRKP